MSHNDMLCDMLNNSVVYFSEDWHISCCIISIFNTIITVASCHAQTKQYGFKHHSEHTHNTLTPMEIRLSIRL